jgi:hypothetical protein
MKLHYLTHFIMMVNSALDTGRYNTLSVADVEEHIQQGDLFSWLKMSLGRDIDLTLFDRSDMADAASRLSHGLESIRVEHAGRERRKWGVERSGLCLLVAWGAELIQRGEWEQ